jgi:uncharacterized protein YbjT (DUF2867 family)
MSSSAPAVDADSSARAVIAGATGLVGAACLRKLLGSAEFAKVTAVARRPLGVADARLDVVVGGFDALGTVPPVPARAGICALGTTIAKAGSQAAFRLVDHDAVIAFARWLRQAGTTTFALVSSVGAALDARSFYLRVKGETEAAVAALGFDRLVILRPSLLLGPRPERRLGESIAQAVVPALNPLLLGPLRIYQAMPGETVAAALITAAAGRQPGHHIWHHDEIVAAANAIGPR